MPYVICVAGNPDPAWWSGLCAELTGRCLKVGLVRKAENPSTGAGQTPELQVSQGSIRLERPDPGPASLESYVSRYLYDLDLVFSEIHEGEKRAKVEFVSPGGSPTLAGDPGLRALIGSGAMEGDLPRFDPTDLAGLADFLQKRVIPEPKADLVRVILEGRRVPANRFVQEIISGTLRGMVTQLKGGERPGRLEIYLD